MRTLLLLVLGASVTWAQDPTSDEALGLEIDGYLRHLVAVADEQTPPGAVEAPELVVMGRRLTEEGPYVPLANTGSRDVLSPERIVDATVTTAEEVIDRLPGVSSRLYSGDEHVRPSISTRGMPDNGFTEYTAVLVDGINYSTLFYGWTALSIFPFTAERIWAAEVYRGAHAIRYGPNTIGGVVNLITTPIPAEGFLFSERIVFGSNAYLSSHTQIGANDAESGWAGLAEYVQKSGDTHRDDNDFDVNEFAVKVRKTLEAGRWIQANLISWRGVSQLPARLTRAQLDADPHQNPTERRIDWHGWAAGGELAYHSEYADHAWYEVYAYVRLARRLLDSGRPSSGPPFTSVRNADSDSWNQGIGVQGEQPFGSDPTHLIHYGLRFHHEYIVREVFEVFDDMSPTNLSSDTLTRTSALAGNVDDTIEIGRWHLNFGVRLEYMDSEGKEHVNGNKRTFDIFDVFPGGSVSYETSERTALFANYHQSFRAPQTWSYDYSGANQPFDFEQGQNAEVGFRWEELRGTQGNLVVWLVDFSDFIEFDPDLDVTTNHGGFRSIGIDLTLDADLGTWVDSLRGWSFFGTVTYQDSEFTKGANDGNKTQFVPDLVTIVGVRYTHASGFYGSVEGRYHGGSWVDAANTITTPGYWLVDARVGWRMERKWNGATFHLDLAVAAKNLFDETYYNRHNATLYIPGTPRELFGSIRATVDF